MEKKEALEKLGKGLGKAISKHLKKADPELLKKAGYEYDKEERLAHAVDNALHTLTNWNVGKLEDIRAELQEEGKSAGIRHCGEYHAQVRNYVRGYKDTAAGSEIHVRRYMEEFRIMLTALQMQMEIVGTAGTHREKDARMRGLCGFLEGLITKVEHMESGFIFSNSRWENIFRSEYPVQHIVHRMNELKAENGELRKNLSGRTAAPTDGTRPADSEELPL